MQHDTICHDPMPRRRRAAKGRFNDRDRLESLPSERPATIPELNVQAIAREASSAKGVRDDFDAALDRAPAAGSAGKRRSIAPIACTLSSTDVSRVSWQSTCVWYGGQGS